jgi:tripartite-type tricarboxylate transporter receptor subunit TctC
MSVLWLIASLLWPAPAWSADEPLTLVTAFVTGSGPDHVARTLAREWSQRSGEAVQVINMPENQGRTAARWVSEHATDGRLLLLTSSRMLDAGPAVPRTQRQRPESSPPLSLQRFKLIARVGELPFMSVFPHGLSPSPMRPRLTLHGGAAATADRPVTRWADPQVEQPADPRVLAALSRLDDLSADPSDRPDAARPSVFPRPFSRPDDVPRTDWNGLLVSAQMPAVRVDALQRQFATILALPEVRWAVAQAGSDLWEEIPPELPVQVDRLSR